KSTLRVLPPPPASRPGTGGKRPSLRPLRKMRRWTIPLAAAVVLGFYFFQNAPAPQGNPETPSNGIALLASTSDAVWADRMRSPGEVLTPGWMRLKSGAVKLEFSRGARVILEGPAELQLVSDNEARIRTGKLRAYVPEPAHGFLVRGPEFAITDLGTEFGCTVPEKGEAEVHVFTGLIALELANLPEAGRQIPENQAMQIHRGQVREIPARPELFLNEEELARRELAYANGRMALWRKASQALSRHPSTLVHLDFERGSDWERSLANRARRGLVDSNATIVGCDWVDGRWPGKGSLEFKRADDRLRLTVPGLYESLTLLAWVRVERLPHSRQSLLMTESFQPGEVHWYLDSDGALGFGVRVNSGESTGWTGAHSHPLIGPGTLETWVLLATVFDGQSGNVTHYFNGQPAGTAPIQNDAPLRLDTFEVGNWAVRADDPKWAMAGVSEPRENVRNFHGRMDEFALLSVPLEAGEIAQIYRDGRPGETGNQSAVSVLIKH
ncbi:MAG: LamG domain-containing protein, partial [Verrucomicrobiota bacterium]